MGERLVVDYSTAGTYPYDVVGVVSDVRFSGPRAEPRQEIYMPHAQRPYLVMNVAVRSEARPAPAWRPPCATCSTSSTPPSRRTASTPSPTWSARPTRATAS